MVALVAETIEAWDQRDRETIEAWDHCEFRLDSGAIDVAAAVVAAEVNSSNRKKIFYSFFFWLTLAMLDLIIPS